MFSNNRALFRTCALIGVEEQRSAELSFGILPYPKFDEAQEEYNNFVSTLGVPGVCIPSTVTDKERTGAIIDAMASEAVNTIRYAYYDQTLYNRLVRDEESYEMLNLIFDTRTYDLGHIYDWGGLGWLLRDMNQSRKTDFTSEYQKLESKAQVELEKTMELYKEFN